MRTRFARSRGSLCVEDYLNCDVTRTRRFKLINNNLVNWDTMYSLRRQLQLQTDSNTDEQIYDFGHFQVYEQSAQLVVDGMQMVCPAREFQLLLFFCKHTNRVFSRDQLFEQVWNETSIGDDNTVTVHILRLREKIEIEPSQPRCLVTVRGLGYKLVTPQTVAES